MSLTPENFVPLACVFWEMSYPKHCSVLRNYFITETEEMWDGVDFWI